MKSHISFGNKFVMAFCFFLTGGFAYAQKPVQEKSDADLKALVNKYLHTPVKEVTQANGDVFLQRDVSSYLHASRKVSVQENGTDPGHDHNDVMLEEFLNRPQPSVATIKRYFDAAAGEFKVPAEILMAAGQVQSNWAQVSASMYGSWGVMGIIENPYIQQISLAADLLKTTTDEIKNNAQTNIRAAAALVAYYQKNKEPQGLDDWFEAVRDLTGLTNEAMKTELAVRIYELIKTGSKTVTLWGEIIYLPAVTGKKILEDVTIPPVSKPDGTTAVDYPGAVAGYSTCPTNYGTRTAGSVINFYFIHYIALGTYQGTLSWFSNCASGVSAHYVVRNSDGYITQVVAEANRAYSQGVNQYNQEGIGTEHEVLVANLTMWDSKPMLAAAASLAADVCNRNSIPKVRRAVNGDRGIYGHSDVRSTDCPNLTPERWDTLMSRIVTANSIVNNQAIAIPVLYSIENPGTGNQLIASWKAATDANLVGYRLYYATNDDLNGWALAADESTLTAATTSVALLPAQFTVPPAGNVYHFKLTTVVSNGGNPNLESASSDIYSRSSNVAGPKVLIVDGFDRFAGSYTAATHPFATSYFKALRDRGPVQVSTVANERVEDGTFNLANFDIVVWFLGDESSANVVFSASEKSKIQTFLTGGGKLLVTGSEIAYNIGRSGSSTYDLAFMNGYLKSNYVGDGAGGYSPATGIAGTDFAGLTIPFGIVYDEDFPDDVNAVSGAVNIFNYAVAGKRGGVSYKGNFGAGTVPGALIYLSWTLETASDISMSAFMDKALLFFSTGPVPVAPLAVADVAIVQADAAKRVNVLLNDIANGGTFNYATLTISSNPVNGSATVAPNGDLLYTPNPGFVGADSLSYTIQNTTGPLVSNAAKLRLTIVPAFACNPNAPETDDAYPKRDLRGAWVSTVSNIDWPSSRTLTTAQQQAELMKILDTLNNTGINTVFLQIRPESDALYASTIDPWSYWLTNAQGTAPNPIWDPLQFAVTQAHARGMDLHAWINPFRAKQSTPILAPNHVATLHPDWTFVAGTITLLNPGLPAVRQYLTNVIGDIANRYDIDGIHFDDYFYPYPPNGVLKQDSATYVDYNPTNIATIADWRRDNVNQLIAKVYDTLQIINALGNRNIVFGVSPFGIWKQGVPAGIVGTSSYNDIYCDPIAWLQAGKVDYVAPQLYWKITGPQDYTALSKWWNDQASLYGNRHIYPGLAAYRLDPASSNWDAIDILSQINLNRTGTHGQVLGQVLFSTKQIMSNIKGIKTELQSNQYRYKAFAPAMGWKDAVCPNAPANARLDGDSLKWDIPVAAADGDIPVKYLVYRYDNVTEVATNANDGKKVWTIVAGNKLTIPSSLPRNGYFVITGLDKNNNESSASNVVLYPTVICNGANVYFQNQNKTAGNMYQWQVNTGGGFVNISDDAIYSGSNADTLRLAATPPSWYGYRYRSVITNGSIVVYGPVITLQFGVTWTGTVDTAWENVANWSCGILPDENTDVYINSGLTNYPNINSNASCRRLKAITNTSVTIKPGFNLDVKGIGEN
ncbi:MAG: family 10 glycosylhydrolase [Chitinophagaceae bacterium]